MLVVLFFLLVGYLGWPGGKPSCAKAAGAEAAWQQASALLADLTARGLRADAYSSLAVLVSGRFSGGTGLRSTEGFPEGSFRRHFWGSIRLGKGGPMEKHKVCCRFHLLI